MKLKNFYTEHESLILGTGFIMVLLAVWESVLSGILYREEWRSSSPLRQNRCRFL
jgi:hypothetical protein